MIRFMKMRWAVHVAHMGMIHACKTVVGKPGGKETLGRFQA
jgi:hypothetical protein